MIKLAIADQYAGYENTLIVDLIRSVAAQRVTLTTPNQCDLLIVGPHRRSASRMDRAKARLESALNCPFLTKRKFRPVILFQTWENVRHDHIAADYCISCDLNVDSRKHLRLPLWMAEIDWSHEGLPVKHSPRVAGPLKIERLMQPLGNAFLRKPRRAALISSHLLEPRRTLLSALSQQMPVDGYGPAFDKTIADHNKSKFVKEDILKHYAYSLCPENSLYPGYYTEKIPEAFTADTLPISWCDVNVCCDFNPDAFINLLPFAASGYDSALAQLTDADHRRHVDAPLLLERPSLEAAREFLRNVLAAAR